MTELEALAGIGRKLATDLRSVGVPDAEALRTLGAEAASDRLEAAGLHDCTHARRALRGAIAGMISVSATNGAAS